MLRHVAATRNLSNEKKSSENFPENLESYCRGAQRVMNEACIGTPQ